MWNMTCAVLYLLRLLSNSNVIVVVDAATALVLATFSISSEESLGERVLRESYGGDAATCRKRWNITTWDNWLPSYISPRFSWLDEQPSALLKFPDAG